LKNGNGIFAKLGEEWFDEYWMNYGMVTMVREGQTIKVSKLKDFLEFKGRADLYEKLVFKNTKKKLK
jgi:hypothetical protein